MRLSEIRNCVKVKEVNEYKKIRIIVFSDITLDPYFTLLMQKVFSVSGIMTVIEMIRYEDHVSNINQIGKSDFVVVILNFESLIMDFYNRICSKKTSRPTAIGLILEQCSKLYDAIKEKTQNPVFWFGFEDYSFYLSHMQGNTALCGNLADEINHHIYEMLNGQVDTFIDTKRLIAGLGIKNAYSIKNKYRWNLPYSQDMISEFVTEIEKQYRITKGITKKCIILDCDNVLWGGILAEDGIEKIRISGDGPGRFYQDFQRYLIWLYYHGIILAVCSKNNLQDVRKVFQEHSGMLLKENHIACFYVNWNHKIFNINQIIDTLNLSPESIVFVDDTEAEIEAVKSALPDVLPVLFNRKTIFTDLACFNLREKADTEQIEKRNKTYQNNEKREKLKDSCKDKETYLKNLDIKIFIQDAKPEELYRIAELSQRTNKCTNGKRYTVSELMNIASEKEYKLYSVSVSDKFSDLGLVGAIGIMGFTLDLFSLSCRAFGRKIEERMLEVLTKNNVTDMEFISTNKNLEIRMLLEDKLKK